MVASCDDGPQATACQAAYDSADKLEIYKYFEEYGYDPELACDRQLWALLDDLECEDANQSRDRRKAYSDYINFFGSDGKCYQQIVQELQDLECAIVAAAGSSSCIPAAYNPEDCSEIVRCLDEAACNTILAKPNSRVVYVDYINTYGALGYCYPQVFQILDSIDCAAARQAADKKKAYYEYLDFFGDQGECSAAFQAEINDCAIAEDEDDCTTYGEYVGKYGEDGLCSQSFIERVKEKNCEKEFDLAVALTQNTPEALQKYLTKYQGNTSDGDYQKVAQRLEAALCDQAREQDKCYLYAQYIQRYGREGNCSGEFAQKLAADYDKTVEEIYTMDLNKLCTDRPTNASIPQNIPTPADQLVVKTLPQGITRTPVCRTFKTRDGKNIDAIKLGPLWFMTDNVNMGQTSNGYSTLLSWHEAQSACPEGWRLPCEQEILFYQEAFYSTPTAAYNGLTNLQDCGFNTKLFEPYYNQNLSSYFQNGVVAHFWLATEASDLTGYSYGLDRNTNMLFIRTTTNKDRKLPCRCVKESDEYTKSKISIIYKGCPNRPKPWLKS